jgi:hypothetical protein
MAKDLGKDADYNYYMSRAKNYQNMFNDRTNFMQGRYSSGNWSKDFDPISPSYLGSGEFTEGNSWQYSWFVPQDIEGLKELIGGDEAFKNKLDSLFTVEADPEKYQMPSDVTGLIGQYAQGNEPSHHIAYLYNYCGYPSSTQSMVRKIMDDFFHSGRDGLCGNEDCGQMSAWYVFSSMGFYPVLPGSNTYVIGSPLFDKITIHQENGKDFVISAHHNSGQNKFIKSIKYNKADFLKLHFTHDDLRSGSLFELEMSPEPEYELAADKSFWPHSSISDEFEAVRYEKYFMPIIEPHRSLFANKIMIELNDYNESTQIKYTLDGTDPENDSEKYIGPFVMDESFILKAAVFGEDLESSDIIQKEFRKTIVYDPGDPFLEMNGNVYPSIAENDKYHSNYTGGGKLALIDGNFGNTDFRDPYWQGYQSNDCDVVIDCGKTIEINNIAANFLENQGSWIFLPQKIAVSFSENGKDFSEEYIIYKSDVAENDETKIKSFGKKFQNINARYIHFLADNIGNCPPYHKGSGNPAFIFIDEIIIE